MGLLILAQQEPSILEALDGRRIRDQLLLSGPLLGWPGKAAKALFVASKPR